MTNREWSYVALSLHRQRLRVCAPEGIGGDLEGALSRSRQKTLACDYTGQPKQVASLEREWLPFHSCTGRPAELEQVSHHLIKNEIFSEKGGFFHKKLFCTAGWLFS
jgi:hypothetical protein